MAIMTIVDFETLQISRNTQYDLENLVTTRRKMDYIIFLWGLTLIKSEL